MALRAVGEPIDVVRAIMNLSPASKNSFIARDRSWKRLHTVLRTIIMR